LPSYLLEIPSIKLYQSDWEKLSKPPATLRFKHSKH
jgi:hypothetical protein